MHDIKWIRENKEEFDKSMTNRGLDKIADHLIELDEEKRSVSTKLQNLNAKRNNLVDQISKMVDKKGVEFSKLIEESNKLKEEIAKKEKELNSHDKLNEYLISLPNLIDSTVPIGPDENSNQIVREVGSIRVFDFTPKSHYEIGEELGMMDFMQTAKISGSRFVTLLGDLAKLERSLASFMLETHTKEFGYTEVSPPILVKDQAMFGVGQLPKFEEDSFATTNSYRIIPTSEASLTNLVRETTLREDQLPIRITAHTPCFRSEAGSAGRDTKGMIRLHQFNKVELVSIVKEEDSFTELERMASAAEYILKKLNLPYRVVSLASGDIGFCALKTYDLEVWLPSEGKYREISSCSNTGSFQARRMKAKYKTTNTKESKFVHSLNGSGLAVGRCLLAIVENYQNQDGSITIPEVLRKYFDNKDKITKIDSFLKIDN